MDNIEKTLFDGIPHNIFNNAIPKPFSFDEAPPMIANFAKAYSEATGHDHSGLIVAALIAAASVIDDRIKLEVQKGSNWTVSARLWGFLCGKSSAGKSPILRATTDPIKALHHQLLQDWQKQNKALSVDEPLPVTAIFTSDATVAALSEILKDNPAGLLMLNEEFSSWVGAIDSADKGEAAKNRGDWLQLRDGGARQINRIGRGTVFVPNWGASVLAATTPDGLSKQMKHMPEDGLIQRFIPCMMQPSVPKRHKGDCTSELKQWADFIKTLYSYTANPDHHHTIKLNQAAQERIEDEFFDIDKKIQAIEDYYPSCASHLGKHKGMLAEVALVFHFILEMPQPSLEISEDTIKLAIKFMRRVQKHAFYLYNSVLSSSSSFELAKNIARSIVADETKPESIGRDWMIQHCSSFKKSDERTRREAIQFLDDMNWLKAMLWERSYNGWPTKFQINPCVYDYYATEGEQWRERRKQVKELITGLEER